MDEKIPFDLELAKKILRGEIGGEFVTRDGSHAKILEILENSELFGEHISYPIFAAVLNDGWVECNTYTLDGYYCEEKDGRDLLIALGETKEHQTPFISSKEKNILYSLAFGNPECKIQGKKKKITGINRIGKTTFVCLEGVDDIEELDNIEFEGEF
jgi:hypothetical protein